MTPEPSSAPETEIADFAGILSVSHEGEAPVIVGGHAVGLWARYYLEKGVAELAEFLPFRSKDLDLVGTMSYLMELHHRFKGVMRRSEPRSPVIGRLDLPCDQGGILRIEVLHTVLGLDAKDLERTVNLRAGNVVARVPFVHLVLKAKLANAVLIAQEGRQDVKHVRMLILCVRAFILELMEALAADGLGERTLINLLNEIREIASSRHAAEVERLWSLDANRVWPVDEMKAAASPKLARWLEHRLT